MLVHKSESQPPSFLIHWQSRARSRCVNQLEVSTTIFFLSSYLNSNKATSTRREDTECNDSTVLFVFICLMHVKIFWQSNDKISPVLTTSDAYALFVFMGSEFFLKGDGNEDTLRESIFKSCSLLEGPLSSMDSS